MESRCARTSSTTFRWIGSRDSNSTRAPPGSRPSTPVGRHAASFWSGPGEDMTQPIRVSVFVTALLLLVAVGNGNAQERTVRDWRSQHEREILDEYFGLLRIPNVAGDHANMVRNADLLAEMFRRRGFTVEATAGEGSPVVWARLDSEPSQGTLTFYIHYDGQPVDPAEWTHCGPFDPCLVGPSGKIALDGLRADLDPEWRVYARSSADDKAPIVALLVAIDALKGIGQRPR